MLLIPTPIPGAYVIEPERRADDRGFFARTFCAREFRANGLNPEMVQCSVSFNLQRGTLRGMHWQEEPHAEDKLVRCSMGAIYDVIIDLRQDSPTFLQHHSVELTQENRLAFYVPRGCAHGFQTLMNNTEVFYQMTQYYAPEAARGARYDDPAFGIAWPEPVQMISDRDRTYPDFTVRC